MTKRLERATDGLGLTMLISLILVALNIGGVISWSWWHLLAPVYLPVALMLVVGSSAASKQEGVTVGLIVAMIGVIPIIGFVTAFFS